MINKGTSERGASFSECGKYRYHLWRVWDTTKPRMCIIGLNPSTADESADDHTIRKCITFAKRDGCGSLSMLNLFALRATNPDEMKLAYEPVGYHNDDSLSLFIDEIPLIVCAWGTDGCFRERDREVWELVKFRKPMCFGVTKHGHPKHPLYLAAKTLLAAYEGPR